MGSSGKAVHCELGESSVQEELPTSQASGEGRSWQSCQGVRVPTGRLGNPAHWRGVNRARGVGAQSRTAFCHTLGAPAPWLRWHVCSSPALLNASSWAGLGSNSAIPVQAPGQLPQNHCKGKPPAQHGLWQLQLCFNTSSAGATLGQEHREGAAVKGQWRAKANVTEQTPQDSRKWSQVEISQKMPWVFCTVWIQAQALESMS